jgi:hypothetical protein
MWVGQHDLHVAEGPDRGSHRCEHGGLPTGGCADVIIGDENDAGLGVRGLGGFGRIATAGTPELRQRYNLSQGSVIKILHTHDVAMRKQGLTNHDAAMAATLYRSGATLAQLSEQFDVSYSAVRRALVSVGVVIEDARWEQATKLIVLLRIPFELTRTATNIMDNRHYQ